MTIHCRVIAFLSADTARDLVTLTFWPWTYMAGHVSNLATKSEDPTPIRSWVMSYNVSHWSPLKMRTRPLRMRRITWPVSRVKRLHFWNPCPWFAYSLYNFYWATTTIKGRLLSSVTNAKALDCVNFLCVTLWPWPLTPLTFDLEQLSYMAGHMINHATEFEDPTTIRSQVTSYNGSHWLPLKMRTRPLRMRRITWPVSRGSKTITFLEFTTPICLFTIQLLLGSDDD